MKSKFVSIIISIVIIFLIAVAVYKSYTPNSKIQETTDISAETPAASEPLTETAPAATAIETISIATTEAILETVEATTEDIDINLPTLKIIVYEGPVIVQDNELCYYRVKAIVTGNPAPFIKFSRDDSGGVWGKNIAQINLKNGESYDLVVTAVNSAGSAKKHMVLTWSQ